MERERERGDGRGEEEASFGMMCCVNGTNLGDYTIRFLTADTVQERAMMIPICEPQTRAWPEDLQTSLQT